MIAKKECPPFQISEDKYSVQYIGGPHDGGVSTMHANKIAGWISVFKPGIPNLANCDIYILDASRIGPYKHTNYIYTDKETIMDNEKIDKAWRINKETHDAAGKAQKAIGEFEALSRNIKFQRKQDNCIVFASVMFFIGALLLFLFS